MAYSTISKSSAYMNPKKYSGTGSTQAITGVGFQPDFSWIKNASSGSNYDHHLYDAIRGATKSLASNNADAETTKATGLTAFDSDGFTVGADVGVNSNGSTLISWNWKANGSGSTNGDGSITTTATSVNTAGGFSICQWTGTGSNATIGHGLGVAPKMIIVKNISTSDSWNVYHESIGNDKRLFLDTTGGESSTSDAWNSASPTTSVFSIGTNTGTNGSGNTLIAYAFAEIPGFSKIGEYAGNANTNGTFIYTGFKPSFLLVKQYSSSGEDWNIYDSKRNLDNSTDIALFPNLNNAEATKSGGMNFLSNGIKMTGTDGAFNTSQNYIYMAFGQPIVSTNGDIATAR